MSWKPARSIPCKMPSMTIVGLPFGSSVLLRHPAGPCTWVDFTSHLFFIRFPLILMAAIVNPVLGIEPALLWTDGRRRRSVLDSYGYMGVANIFLIFFLISIDSEFAIQRSSVLDKFKNFYPNFIIFLTRKQIQILLIQD